MFTQPKLRERASSVQICVKNIEKVFNSTLATSPCALKTSEAPGGPEGKQRALFLRGLLVSLLGFTVSSNLTPISNVVKIAEHFLLLF